MRGKGGGVSILWSPSLGSNTLRQYISRCLQERHVLFPENHWGFLGGRWWRVCLQCGRPGFDPWVRKIPWRRKWQPTPVLLPEKFHGLRSLVGYSPWGHKESDTTEQLHFTSLDFMGWYATSKEICLWGFCSVQLPHLLAQPSLRQKQSQGGEEFLFPASHGCVVVLELNQTRCLPCLLLGAPWRPPHPPHSCAAQGPCISMFQSLIFSFDTRAGPRCH